MDLIKYRDEMNGEIDYSYFWVHRFKDDTERVVSPVFETKQLALEWGQQLKEQIKNKQ
jgi:hypothetical protein